MFTISKLNSIHEIQVELLRTIRDAGSTRSDSTELYGNICIEFDKDCDMISKSVHRNFSQEYSDAFFNYVISGEGMDEHRAILSSLSHGAADKFLVEFEGRNTQYGPRIAAQLPLVVEELKTCPESRRAWISILQPSDAEFLPPKRDGTTTIEFPCTASIGFHINNDNQLESLVIMRSSCAVIVFNYDARNFYLLTAKVADMLGLEQGPTKMVLGSAHIYKKYDKLVDKMLGISQSVEL